MDCFKNQLAPTLTVCHRPGDRGNHDKEEFRSKEFKDTTILVVSYFNQGAVPPIDTTYPLVCNKEETKDKSVPWCRICSRYCYTSGYYFCEIGEYNYGFHKECIERMEKNSYHPKHSLHNLIYMSMASKCHCCDRDATLFHYCSVCNFSICHDCARKPPLLTIDHKKRHEHPLSYIPREASITCDVCALDDRRYFIYICIQCDFVVHKECIYSPRIIKTSRHEHRLSFNTSFHPGEHICGVCRKKIDENYGGYSCVKGCSYVVHSKCATQRNVWDKKELDGVTDEDAYEDITPFKEISDGIIQHFSHNHYMRLHEDIDIVNEDEIYCQACALRVYEGDSFNCMECDFVLHRVCAYLPLKKQHVLHPHPLVLQKVNQECFSCTACNRVCNAFRYKCESVDCGLSLDMCCASVSEPMYYQSHPHHLFIPTETILTRICSICNTPPVRSRRLALNCGECEFSLCFRCATLPNKFRYKNDEHPLIFSYEKDYSSGCYYCDVCEEEIYPENGIYKCDDCDTTLHINCLFGTDMIMVAGNSTILGENCDILFNNHLTRYICKECDKRCQYKIVYQVFDKAICYCSMSCIFQTRLRSLGF